MARSHRNEFNIAFLFVFLFLTLVINYFHTEVTLKRCENCPACQFLYSTMMTAQIHFFHLPQLLPLESLSIFQSSALCDLFFIATSSRSPPQT